jgi:hypothetical protein
MLPGRVRGLVLVKWWLLAIPHYVIITFFIGGSYNVTGRYGAVAYTVVYNTAGLIAWLVLVVGIALLFTARYPRGIFDFVLGMDRWVLRVGAYVSLMSDSYPPFRLDQGGADPAQPVASSCSPTSSPSVSSPGTVAPSH